MEQDKSISSVSSSSDLAEEPQQKNQTQQKDDDYANEKAQLSAKQFKLFLNIRGRDYVDHLNNSELIRYILSNETLGYNKLLNLIAQDKKKKQAV